MVITCGFAKCPFFFIVFLDNYDSLNGCIYYSRINKTLTCIVIIPNVMITVG